MEYKSRKKPLIVVAGAVPPPIGGQAMMVSQIVEKLQDSGRFRVAHLAFRFTRNTQQARRASLLKIAELLMVWLRLAGIRLQNGKIDCTLYPIGGPQLVPTLRDILLLPGIFLLSRKVVLHFHAGGVPETIDTHPKQVSRLAKWLYSRADAAISLTDWGRTEPEALGIESVYSVPLDFADAFNPAIVSRHPQGPPAILCLGHICEEKGTVILLESLGKLRQQGFEFTLDLVGECLFPFTESMLGQVIEKFGMADVVTCRGVLSGYEKWRSYAESDLFVFPSLARESFGIVMAEAMMWELPVLAFDWRANREVLGNPPEELLADTRKCGGLEDALRTVLSRQEKWPAWGQRMRAAFLMKYSTAKEGARLIETLEKICDP